MPLIKYVILNKWVELALVKQEIVVLRFLRAAWGVQDAVSSENLFETLR